MKKRLAKMRAEPASDPKKRESRIQETGRRVPCYSYGGEMIEARKRASLHGTLGAIGIAWEGLGAPARLLTARHSCLHPYLFSF